MDSLTSPRRSTPSSLRPSTGATGARIRKIYPLTTRRTWYRAKVTHIRTASQTAGAATGTMAALALPTGEQFSSMMTLTCPASQTTRRSASTAFTTSTAMEKRRTSRTGRRVQARTNHVSGSRIRPQSKRTMTTLCLRRSGGTMGTPPPETATLRTSTGWTLSDGTRERMSESCTTYQTRSAAVWRPTPWIPSISKRKMSTGAYP